VHQVGYLTGINTRCTVNKTLKKKKIITKVLSVCVCVCDSEKDIKHDRKKVWFIA
jgi:hypothetical protein